MKYKVGDKVRVRKWDDMEKEFGLDNGDIAIPHCYFTFGMKKHCNYVVTISEETERGKYHIKEDNAGWFWCDEMFESNYSITDKMCDDLLNYSYISMKNEVDKLSKEIKEMKEETKSKQPKQKTKRERIMDKMNRCRVNSGINSIEIIVPNKVVKIKMDAMFVHWNNEYKMVCDDRDTFSLERAIYLAYAKDECRGKYTSEGIEAYADQISMEKKFVAKVKAAMNLYESQEELKKLDEEEAAMIQRKREKRWKQKERRAERKRNEQIAMQKEAYVQAWKEIEELKNHELEKDIDLIELTEENAEDISVEE